MSTSEYESCKLCEETFRARDIRRHTLSKTCRARVRKNLRMHASLGRIEVVEEYDEHNRRNRVTLYGPSGERYETPWYDFVDYYPATPRGRRETFEEQRVRYYAPQIGAELEAYRAIKDGLLRKQPN